MMLRKLAAAIRGMANDPTVLVLVGMTLLTRGLDVIAEQITAQAIAVQDQVRDQLAAAQRDVAEAPPAAAGDGRPMPVIDVDELNRP